MRKNPRTRSRPRCQTECCSVIRLRKRPDRLPRSTRADPQAVHHVTRGNALMTAQRPGTYHRLPEPARGKLCETSFLPASQEAPGAGKAAERTVMPGKRRAARRSNSVPNSTTLYLGISIPSSSNDIQSCHVPGVSQPAPWPRQEEPHKSIMNLGRNSRGTSSATSCSAMQIP